jgi:hypothetical protein
MDNINKYISSGKKAYRFVSDLLESINGEKIYSATYSRLGRKRVELYGENEVFSWSYNYDSHRLQVYFKENMNGKNLDEIKCEEELKSRIKQLIPDTIMKKFDQLGDISSKPAKDIKIIVKLFNPTGAGTWYLYDKIDDDVYMCFANLGDSDMAELGTVSISELASFKGMFGLGIERDKFFGEDKTLESVIEEVKN